MTVPPIVIGASGAVTDMFEKYTLKLNVTIRLEVIRKNCSVSNSWTIIMERFAHLETQVRTPSGPSGTFCLLSRVIDPKQLEV